MGDIKKVLTKVGKLPSFDYLEMLRRHWRRRRAVEGGRKRIVIRAKEGKYVSLFLLHCRRRRTVRKVVLTCPRATLSD
jgi:hypothetical protein